MASPVAWLDCSTVGGMRTPKNKKVQNKERAGVVGTGCIRYPHGGC